MARTIALIAARRRFRLEELVRALVVTGCALALILADHPFPSGL